MIQAPGVGSEVVVLSFGDAYGKLTTIATTVKAIKGYDSEREAWVVELDAIGVNDGSFVKFYTVVLIVPTYKNSSKYKLLDSREPIPAKENKE